MSNCEKEQHPDSLKKSSKNKHQRGQQALKGILRPVRGQLFVAQVLSCASAIFAVAPYVALVHLGEVLGRGDNEEVNRIIKLLIGAFLMQLFLYFLALLVSHLADSKLVGINRRRIIRAIASAPLAWCSQTNSGKVRKAVEDDTLVIHSLVAHAPVDTVAAVTTPCALLVYAFTVDWRLGLLTIATVPIYLLMQVYSMKDMAVKTAEMDEYLGEISATAVEFVEGISVVKAFGTVGKTHRRYEEAAQAFAKFYYAWVGPLMRVSALSDSVIAIPLILLVNVGGGALLVYSGQVGVADVITTTLIAFVIPGTIQTLGSMGWNYQLAGNSALHLEEVMNLDPMKEGNVELPANSPASVEYKDVTFSYGGTPVVENFSARLEPGTVTALVGPSGSGKSTLATMLARFQDPDEGTVSIGGVDVRNLSFASLYRTVSFVLQDPHLLAMSLRDNIVLAKPDASEAEIWQAAKIARIDKDIRALPKGLDTVVGSDVSLSGGQQQRISIARAVLTDAPILILDEATTATDPECEADIQAGLTSLARGKTVLVIAHKPESIVGVDQILDLCAWKGKEKHHA